MLHPSEKIRLVEKKLGHGCVMIRAVHEYAGVFRRATGSLRRHCCTAATDEKDEKDTVRSYSAYLESY